MNDYQKLTYTSYGVGAVSTACAVYVLLPLKWSPLELAFTAFVILFLCAGIHFSTMTACQPTVANLGIRLGSVLVKTALLQVALTLAGSYVITTYGAHYTVILGVGLLFLLAQLPSFVTYHYTTAYHNLQYPGAKNYYQSAGATIGVRTTRTAPPPPKPRFGQWFWKLPQVKHERPQSRARQKAPEPAVSKDLPIAEKWRREGRID